MSSFSDRLRISAQFETRLIQRLRDSGWFAFQFGQAQLPDSCRARLVRFRDLSHRPCLIRWMPDIITFRDLPDGHSFVALIDAKVSGQTGNYAIETSAIETAEIYTDQLFTPTFFAFDDWKILTPREARQRGRAGPVSFNGSGTPYLLIDKRYGAPLESIFGPLSTAEKREHIQ